MSAAKLEKVHPLRTMRRAGVPLAAFETADPAQTIRACVASLNGAAEDPKPGQDDSKRAAVLEWDIVNGLTGRNKLGKKFVKEWYDPLTMQLPEILQQCGERAFPGLLVFLHNAQRFFERDGVSQAIWNCRDAFKANAECTLVLLGPALMLPAELAQDVVVITEPLPNEPEVSAIVEGIVSGVRDSSDQWPKEYGHQKAVDTLLGLSAFAAEQALAMSMGKTGIDFDGLWERKRRTVEQTPGLSIWRGADSFKTLGGLSNIKDFLTKILTSGRTPVRAIGFIDEIEKGFAGSSGDLSGVSQDQLQVFLKVMQDFDIPGIILVGPPGTGKSAIAKGAGSVSGAEVLSIDTGAMTGSLVGESQRKIRQAMEVFKAVSQGKGMFIATCNRITSLPPELKRRFTLGTFYVDLPSEEEREAIWPIWLKKYGLAKQTLPDCEGWTGAEIKACCDVAYRADLPLKAASEFIVPVCKSAADQIATLRSMAAGRFISANEPGIYEPKEKQTTGRKIGL
jgi:hypothetical protein